MTVAGRGIGIDVGAWSVKVAVVRRHLGGLVLEQVAERPIPREAAGRPAAEALSAAAAAAIEEVRIGRALVVAGVPTHLSTVRNLDVPFRQEARIRHVVKTEVESHLPFAAEDIVVDYCLTGLEREAPVPTEQEGGTQEAAAPTNLLITAVQKKVVGDLLGIVRSERLDPEVADVEFMGAFGAARTLAPQAPEGGELIVDIGAVKTSVIYARRGRPLAVRAFNFGGDTLTQAVAKATDASFADAEARKQSAPRLPGGEAEADPAARAMAEALDGLRRGLDQTVRFFAGQVGEVAYDRLLLTGGSAALGGLTEWLAAALGKEVTRLDSLGPVKNAAGEALCVARFATAIGLALRGVGESVALQNFRQEELVYPNPLKRLVKFLAPAAGFVVCIVAAALVGYYISYLHTLATQKHYEDIKLKEISAVLGRSVAYPTLEALKRVVDERAAEFESLSGENPQSVLDVLHELSRICYGGKAPPAAGSPPESIENLIKRSAPWKIQLTLLQMERGRVSIEGSAANYTAINDFKHALEASPRFARVDLLTSETRLGRSTLKMRLYLKER
jgi:type IV pilus assembly protein PilM